MAELLESAVSRTTSSVPTARRDERIADARGRLLANRYDSVGDVVVLDGPVLVGMVPIEVLLAASAEDTIESVMDRDPPVVSPDVDQARVAHQMVERAECSIAVADADGRFVGLIPPHMMLAVLLAQNDRFLARLGGYSARGRQARAAAEEAVRLRIWHRLPWLLVGLAGAMVTAVIVGSFEEQLRANVLIAVFVPAVVYIADAVGTQTETVLIRAMAAGVTVRSVARQEALSGAAIGAVIATAFFLFALLVWGDAPVATAVGLALVASCSIATGVAMVLPAAIRHFGGDPAFGSGPLATVIQDLLSVLVYLAIASAIAT